MIYCRDVAAVPLEQIGPVLENAPDLPAPDQRPLRRKFTAAAK